MTPKEKKYLNYGFYGVAAVGILYLIFAESKEDGGGSEDPTGNGTTVPGSTVFNAKAIAEKLYDAMKETGTKTQQILTALETVSQTQFGQVVTAFGRRSYNAQMGNQINFNPFFNLPLVNLKGWLEEELDAGNYDTLRKKYPNYL